MRKNKQILLAIFLSLILLVLVFWAAQGKKPPEPLAVVRVVKDLPAGSQISADDLEVIWVENQSAFAPYYHDLESATGLWTAVPIVQGAILLPEQLSDQIQGVFYQNPAPGRRLMTIELRPGQINGLYLASGNRVDIYLVPKAIKPDLLTEVISGIRVAKLLNSQGQELDLASAGNQPNTTVLLCLDLDSEQARLLAEAVSRANIQVAVCNES